MGLIRFQSRVAYCLIVATAAISMSVTTYDGGMINSLNVVVPYATRKIPLALF